MADFVVAVAVEKYRDSRIPEVRYAEADANEFAQILEEQGFVIASKLLSSDATKTTIESEVRGSAGRLTKDDRLFLYYAGHGFSSGGRNFITCHDTALHDLDRTSISLEWLLETINDCPSSQCAIFLDSCHSGLMDLKDLRGIYSGMTEGEIETFFKSAEHRVCFSACRMTEKSYSDQTLKHGIWTHHLIAAMTGNAPDALEANRYVTAYSLQNYLGKEVPLTLRKVRSDKATQIPVLYGSHTHDFKIVDLQPLLDRRQQVDPSYAAVKDFLFRRAVKLDIKYLSGFKKGLHTVPKFVGHSANIFVEKISESEVGERIETVHGRIKEYLGYKAREVTSVNGKIITPDFEYSVYCGQDEEDAARALLVEELSKIQPSILANEDFNRVFREAFAALVVELSGPPDIPKIIDTFENVKPDGAEIDYDSQRSWCEISFDNSLVKLRITNTELTVSNGWEKQGPKELMGVFLDVSKQLAGHSLFKLLLPEATKPSGNLLPATTANAPRRPLT
jgi:hypothetical protein